jgi:transcriptional regulator with XRE-family HTH domain
MKLRSVIRKSRRRAGLTQEQLAAKAEVSLSTIRDIEAGRSATPHQGTLTDIAQAFGYGTWEEFLAAEAGATPFSQQGKPGGMVPLFEQVPAGSGDYDPGADDNHQGVEWVPANPASAPPDAAERITYAVRVAGTSMSPMFEPGDVVFVSRDAPHFDGMAAVFRTRDGDCGLKLVHAEGEGDDQVLVMTPKNPNHPVVRYPRADLVQLARVMWHTRKVPGPEGITLGARP